MAKRTTIFKQKGGLVIDNIKEFYKKLNTVKVDDNAVKMYLGRLLELDLAKYGDFNKQKQQTIDLINNSINLEIGRTGATLFGLYNGLTHYANHEINTKDSDSVLTGVGSRLIFKTEKLMLELAK